MTITGRKSRANTSTEFTSQTGPTVINLREILHSRLARRSIELALSNPALSNRDLLSSLRAAPLIKLPARLEA